RATASVLCGAVAMLPFALAQLPDAVGWEAPGVGCCARHRWNCVRAAGREPADRRARPGPLDARQLPSPGLRAPLRGHNSGRAVDRCEARRSRADPRRRGPRVRPRRLASSCHACDARVVIELQRAGPWDVECCLELGLKSLYTKPR